MRKKLSKKRKAQTVEIRFLESLYQRFPEDLNILKALADLYTKIGHYKDGLNMDIKLSELCPEEPEVWYNLGCSYALLNQQNLAFRALHKAIDTRYEDIEWMAKDPDLQSLHGDTRFHEIITSVTYQY
ncbi:MAG: hypothetical protein GKR87_05435 [Kiritimatiellae bacterium]|nr:hypothetical protein [Kiritimatiellia bacterium]